MVNKVFEDTSKPFSKKQPPEHLRYMKQQYEYEKEREEWEENSKNRSKFDMDPKDVNIDTIKQILTGGDHLDEMDDEKNFRKPINKQ